MERSGSRPARAGAAWLVVVGIVVACAGSLALGATPASAAVAQQHRRVATGTDHVCAITSAGTVKCWGGNAQGQVGNGTTTRVGEPVDLVGAPADIVSLAAAKQSTCALTSGGAVWCWGSNTLGQLGIGATGARSTPTAVPALSSGVAAIEGGDNTYCALTTAGGVWCWGYNSSGQLGNGATTTSNVPVQVTGLTSGVTSIAVGANHNCAVKDDATAVCWGLNGSGQLGTGSATPASSTVPVAATLAGTSVRQLAVTTLSSCALSTLGGVTCWGSGSTGRLGNGATTNAVTAAVQVTGLTSGIASIEGGSGHTCAITRARRAKCWGDNEKGRQGSTPTGNVLPPFLQTAPHYWTIPADASSSTRQVMTLSIESTTGCLAYDNGTVACSGWAADGEIPTTTENFMPLRWSPKVVSGTGTVDQVAASGGTTCYSISVAGTVHCFGSNSVGQVGSNSSSSEVYSPASVSGVSGATALSGAGTGFCARQFNGAAACWGSYPGDGTTGALVAKTPTGGGADVAEVAVGTNHRCMLLTSGSVKCWGTNANGQLGNFSTQTSTTPAAVFGLTDATHIDAGGTTTCAVRSTGAVACWGKGTNGEIGDGALVDRTAPAQVSGLTSGWTSVRVGATSSCALATDGTVKCWGNGAYGALGDGTTARAATPVTVSGLDPAVSLSEVAGDTFCATSAASRVACWGRNDWGQIGDRSTQNRTTPVQVVAASGTVTKVAGGLNHACSAAAGVLRCWGRNQFGEIGVASPSANTFSYTTIANVATGVAPNAAPVAAAQSISAPAGTATQVVLTATDDPLDLLHYGVATAPTKGTLTCAGAEGQICTYTPTPEERGTDTFTFTVNDGLLTSAPATVTLTLDNHGPVAEDQSITAVRHVDTPITLGASDADGDGLSFAYSPAGKGDLTCAADGACTYRSRPGEAGSDSFDFVVSDGLGESDTGTVSITLENTAPVAAAGSQDVPRRVPTSITLSGSDGNDDTLTYSVGTSPSKGQVACSGPACTYQSDPGATGTDSFTFSVDDGFGGTDAATVDIALTNSDPVADPLATSAVSDVATPITLSGSDPNGDDLSFEGPVSGPAQGTVTCDAAGSCSYRSSPGATGSDSFTFTVDDGHGGTDSATVDISLSRSMPVAEPQSVTAPRQVPTLITLSGTDPEGDPLTYRAPVSGPSKGTLDCADHQCVYTSDPGATGTDSFVFEVSDGSDSDTATISIALGNSAPIGAPGSVTVTKGTSKTFHLAAEDPNGDPLTYAITTAPDQGTVTCSGAGGATCTYTATGAVGPDSLSFTATDPDGSTSVPTTVAITIAPPKVSIGNVQVLEPPAGSANSGALIPLSISTPLPTAVTISYYTVGGSAVSTATPRDFLTWGTPTSPRTITIGAGATLTSPAVPVVGDTLAEGTQSFTVKLVSVVAADGSPVAIGDDEGRVDILDNVNATGDPALYVLDHELYEGNQDSAPQRGQFRVDLSKATTAATTFGVLVTDGTATGAPAAGADYSTRSVKTWTVPAGTRGSFAFDYSVWSDTVAEPDETFTLTMIPVSGDTVIQAKATGTATILDDDS